jgi:predicted dehydrogenase
MNLISRRRFLGKGGAAVASSAFVGPNLLLKGQDAAGKRLNLAVVGANGKGLADTGHVTLDHNIVALCDVAQDRLEDAAKKREKVHYEHKNAVTPNEPKLYNDYRKMLDEMAGQIDGVIISTPDHTHYPAAMWAINHGKHVAVQKPLCNTIDEVRKLHAAAKAKNLVTQMGNQGRTMHGQRMAKEWIEQGVIGTLKEIHLWTNRPIWPQGPIGKKVMDAPAGFDWDLWLGVEAAEPYFELDIADEKQLKRGRSVHPFNWRGWWQFGSGALGDMGCHIMDATFSILGQIIPDKIEVESSPISALNAPQWSSLKYHMPAGKHPALVVNWQDGSKDGVPNKPVKPDGITQDTWDKATSGMLFVGTDGMVFEGDAYCKSPRVFSNEKFTQVRKDTLDGKIKQTETRSAFPENPQGEWAHMIVNGGTPVSNFDYSCPLTEFVLLGNLAVRAQQAINWDTKAMKVTNVEAANAFIKRPAYRPGFGV